MNQLTKKNIIKFRKDLKKGKALIGGWLQISSSNISEIMGDYSYDWLTIDMEHGSFSVKDLPDIFRSIELKNKRSQTKKEKTFEGLKNCVQEGYSG